MIVPLYDPQEMADYIQNYDSEFVVLCGQVGPWTDPEPIPEKPRRPIGFRMRREQEQ